LTGYEAVLERLLRSVSAILFMAATLALAPAAHATTIDRICELIELHSSRNDLPAEFLARLIWKESRFDPNAVSPKGAEGVAQFMPATASLRGLADAFDVEQAIPASAEYLSELQRKFGNLGLAAAAYNAGEARVSRWMVKGGFLPLETEGYVYDILGAPADQFLDEEIEITIPKLDPARPFKEACVRLPVSARTMTAMASTPTKPWGIQIAGNFRRDVAIRAWERLRRSHTKLLAAYEPVVSRVRSGRSPRGIYAVRIGAESRSEADQICGQLRQAGAPCIVLRNRVP